MAVTFEQAMAARDEARILIQAIVPVVGVGITKVGKDFAIGIDILRRPPKGTRLPKEVNGVPLRIRVGNAGPILPLSKKK